MLMESGDSRRRNSVLVLQTAIKTAVLPEAN